MNGCLVNPAAMYKKEIAALTEELARVKERSKAAIQDLETVLARRELEQAELKKDLDEERYLRKQVEKNGERIEAARHDLETELAKLRDSLAKRELEQAEPKKDLDEERLLPKELETGASNELPISILRSDGPGVTRSPSEPMAIVHTPNVQVESPSIPNGIYIIKNRTGKIYWSVQGWPSLKKVIFYTTTSDISEDSFAQVNDHSSFSNYSSAERIIVLRSGKSYVRLMVTSPCNHSTIMVSGPGKMLYPRGLVLNLLGLRRQFRGD